MVNVMNNKKMYIIVLVIIIVLGLYYYLMIFKDGNVKLSVHEAGNFTKYNSELPIFEIRVGGMVNAGVTKAVLDANNVEPYEFEAFVETNWGNYKNKYVGYKLTDFLKVFKDQSYKSVTAINTGGVSVTYPLDIINSDKVFIVFYKDGEQIVKGKIAIISVGESEKYSIENVVSINLNSAEVK